MEKITAEDFLKICKENNVKIERLHPVLTLTKEFTPGDSAGYSEAESSVSILYSVPCTESGSIWGTDGLSIGGMVGLKNGLMRLNRSGVSKRFI